MSRTIGYKVKSDKPFQRSLVCGGVFFLFCIALCLIFTGTQNFRDIKYGRVCFVSFVPATLVAVWAFFSKKQWSWGRFIIVTTISCLASLIPVGYYVEMFTQDEPPAPKIVFSVQIPSSWAQQTGKSITDVTGKPIGHQLLLKNKDHKRAIWVEAWNDQRDFKSCVRWWRQLMETRSVESGFHLLENKFTFDKTGGREVAMLDLRTEKANVTRYITCRCWAQELEHEQIVVTYEAMGENVETENDKEIAEIISSLTIEKE